MQDRDQDRQGKTSAGPGREIDSKEGTVKVPAAGQEPTANETEEQKTDRLARERGETTEDKSGTKTSEKRSTDKDK